MPRCCSSAIQSDLARRCPALALTAPASATAPAYSKNFSVSVVFPASGWLMMAKVRRRAASVTTSPWRPTSMNPTCRPLNSNYAS